MRPESGAALSCSWLAWLDATEGGAEGILGVLVSAIEPETSAVEAGGVLHACVWVVQGY